MKKYTVNVRNPNMFGFRTEHVCSVINNVRYEICLKSEQICSDFRRFALSEIRTWSFERSDFGHIWSIIWCVWNPNEKIVRFYFVRTNQTERSIVRISALFGFRTFGFRTFTVIKINFDVRNSLQVSYRIDSRTKYKIWTPEIQTWSFERSDFGHIWSIIWCVRNPNDLFVRFGLFEQITTEPKFVRISAFAEIRTFGFRTLTVHTIG